MGNIYTCNTKENGTATCIEGIHIFVKGIL